MKRTFTFLSLAITATVLLSCKKEAEATDNTITEPEVKTYAQLEKASWLLGEWGNKSAEDELTERWKKENDSVFNGESYFVVGGKDTVFSESVRLEEAGGKLAYIVTVPGQNGEKPVRFEMTSTQGEKITFENSAHDFPSKIVYSKIGNDSLTAEISGMKDGKPASEIFTMKKQ